MTTRIALVAAALAGLVPFAAAQPPQPAAMPATKKHAYDITSEAGQWCICIKCFFENFESPAGRDFSVAELEQMFARSKARRLAIDFVTVLRRDYKLPAYMFNRGDEERRKEEERVADQRRQREELYRKMGAGENVPQKYWNKRLYHIQDQYMVLIGGYADQDAARKSLDAIRNISLPRDRRELEEFGEKFCDKHWGGLQTNPDQKPDGVWTYANPFRTAMLVPNPTGPKIKAPTIDAEELSKALLMMNAKNPFNLLKNQGKWTLVVKLYRVPSNFVGRDGKNGGIERMKGTDMSQAYENVGKAAVQLAEILRTPQLNFDAYVLHTHNSSMVTVGIFDSERDPRLATMQARLAKLSFDVEQLMSPPMPIPVPVVK